MICNTCLAAQTLTRTDLRLGTTDDPAAKNNNNKNYKIQFGEQQKQAKISPAVITLVAVALLTSVDLHPHSLLAIQ